MHFLLQVVAASAVLNSVLCGNGYPKYSYGDYTKYGKYENYGKHGLGKLSGSNRLISLRMVPSISTSEYVHLGSRLAPGSVTNLKSVSLGSGLRGLRSPYHRRRISGLKSMNLGSIPGVSSSYLTPNVDGLKSLRPTSRLGIVRSPYLTQSVGSLKSLRPTSRLGIVRSPYLTQSVGSLKYLRPTSRLGIVRSPYLTQSVGSFNPLRFRSNLRSVSSSYLPESVGSLKSLRLRSKLGRVRSPYLIPRMYNLKSTNLGLGIGSMYSSHLGQRLRDLKSPYRGPGMIVDDSGVFNSELGGSMLAADFEDGPTSGSFIRNSVDFDDFPTSAVSTHLENVTPDFAGYRDVSEYDRHYRFSDDDLYDNTLARDSRVDPSLMGESDLSSLTYSKIFSGPAVSEQVANTGLVVTGYDGDYDADYGLEGQSVGNSMHYEYGSSGTVQPTLSGRSSFSTIKYTNPIRKYASKLVMW